MISEGDVGADLLADVPHRGMERGLVGTHLAAGKAPQRCP